jgi:tetratricopeptide (TPR) repeat protein
LAETLFYRGQAARAIPLLEAAVEQRHEKADDAKLAAAMLLEAMGGGEQQSARVRALLGRNLGVARAFLAHAIVLLRSGETERAEIPLRIALEIADDDPVPWLFLQQLSSDPEMTAYPASDPRLQAKLEAAARHFESGETKKVERIVSRILETRPYHVPARLLVIQDAEKNGDPFEALAGYRQLLVWLPGIPTLQAKAAQVANTMGASELAECLLLQALEIAPGDGSLHRLLGVARLASDNYEGAVQSSLQALELGIDDAALYATLGQAYILDMQISESIEAYSRALELDPTAAQVIPSFALSSLTTEQFEVLRGLLTRHIEAHPTDTSTLYSLGVMSLRDNDLERARSYLEPLAELTPNDSKVQYNLGSLYLRAGEKERGEATMQRFRELKAAEDEWFLRQNSAFRRRLQARDLAAGGDSTAALRIYAELSTEGLADVEDLLAAGRLCLQAGDFAGARAWFEAVLEAEPYRREALEGLVHAAEGVGDSEMAQGLRDRLEVLTSPCGEASTSQMSGR